jgi:membrane protease YdiL (CAAX protease family)
MQFAPSFGIIALIAVVSTLYLRYSVKYWCTKEKINSIEWVEKNRSKLAWRISVPLMYVQAPTLEELIFRGPLLLLFAVFSLNAWIGVVVSAILFGASHWFGLKVDFSEAKYRNRTDDLSAEAKRVEKEQPKIILRRRLAHTLVTCFLGLIAGYCTVKYQSLWAGVLVHMVWNMFVPLLVIIFSLILQCIQYRKDIKEYEKMFHSSVSYRTSGNYNPHYRPELDKGAPLMPEDERAADKPEENEEGHL